MGDELPFRTKKSAQVAKYIKKHADITIDDAEVLAKEYSATYKYIITNDPEDIACLIIEWKTSGMNVLEVLRILKEISI